MPTHAPEAHPDPLAFNPPREKIPQILDHLDTPFASLAMVAHANGTTVEALSLWLLTPEIKARNKLIDTAAAQRTHSLALRNARRGLALASQIVERATEEDVSPAFSSHPKAILARTKSRELAIRASRVVLQILALDPIESEPAPRRRAQRRTYRMLPPPAPQDIPPRTGAAPQQPEPATHTNRAAALLAPPDTAAPALRPPRPLAPARRRSGPADLIARAGAPPGPS